MKRLTSLERFEERYVPEPNTGCWLWTSYLNKPDGYGLLSVNGRSTLAHVFSYEQAKGPVPEGLELDHLCRTRSCVNPAHLEAVTHAENVRRGTRHDLIGVCLRGHPMTGANVYTHKNGRACVACRKLRKQEARAS